MDSLSLFLSCFKWSVLNNGQLEFIFVIFRVVSPKQRTNWVIFVMFRAVSPKQKTAWVYLLSCFRWLVLNNGQLEFTFHFPKSVIPCFIRKRDVTQIFRIITKNFIPRFVGSRNIKQISFLALSDYGISNFIPRFVGLRNIKFHSPLCRIMEYQKTSFPGLPDYGRSLKFYFLKNVIPSVSGREVSLKSLSPLSYRSEPIR